MTPQEVRSEIDRREEIIASLKSENARLTAELDQAESLLASTTDLANSWAREWGVTESYNEKGVNVLIGELWDKAANKAANIRQKRDALATELAQFRVRIYGLYRAKGCDHTTACAIWGDNGQGGTAEGFAEPLPCTCGALLNYEKQQRDALATELDLVRRNFEAIVATNESLATRCRELEADKARLGEKP